MGDDAGNLHNSYMDAVDAETMKHRAAVREAKREDLAAYAHDAWAGWMKHLFAISHVDRMTGVVTIPACSAARWEQQMHTAYADLPEHEKESDRVEADKILGILED